MWVVLEESRMIPPASLETWYLPGRYGTGPKLQSRTGCAEIPPQHQKDSLISFSRYREQTIGSSSFFSWRNASSVPHS